MLLFQVGKTYIHKNAIKLKVTFGTFTSYSSFHCNFKFLACTAKIFKKKCHSTVPILLDGTVVDRRWEFTGTYKACPVKFTAVITQKDGNPSKNN